MIVRNRVGERLKNRDRDRNKVILALVAGGFSPTRSAKILGINRSSLRAKIIKLGIHVPGRIEYLNNYGGVNAAQEYLSSRLIKMSEKNGY